MNHIVLTAEQAQIVQAASSGQVEVRDEAGRTVGSLRTLTPEDLLAIEQSKRFRGTKSPGIPSAQVQAHLHRLEEIRQREGMDEAKMLDLLRRMQAGEQV
jgi:hypothetical protein